MALPIQPSFDDLSTPLFDITFCILDLETTGGSPASCEITEIGAVKYCHGEEVGSFQTLVDPGGPIPASITMLTGITHAMVYDAPMIETALPSFLEFIGDAVLVGHNVRFDMSFLNAATDRLGYARLDNARVDTAALGRRLIRGEVRNLKLASLAAFFRSPVVPNHRALDDAKATAHVLHGLLERAGSLGVTNIDDLLALPQAKGARYYTKIRLSDQLPPAPGVYMFRDRNGAVIYVGKATNLRQRVRQYFYGDTRKTIGNMMREMASIDHQVCPTVLEAEVTELRLIHAHRPRYNRRSRPPKSSHFVRVTRERFPRLSVVRTVKEDALAHLGPFRSKKAADLVVAAIWDAIPVRRCMGRPASRGGSCAPAQLGVALCPCDGRLDPGAYSRVIDDLLTGLNHQAEVLLEPLRERMEQYSMEQRFEEASWARDRHNALARSLLRRQRWAALESAGMFEAVSASGEHVLVDHGILVTTWRDGSLPLLGTPTVGSLASRQAAPTVEAAEESALIWNWLEGSSIRLVSAQGGLALPMTPVRILKVGRAAA
ncbi:MAG: DEDD exonuclease domain-containing protein [Acidimicrobiia bacterium]